jgi:hypothetical protein
VHSSSSLIARSFLVCIACSLRVCLSLLDAPTTAAAPDLVGTLSASLRASASTALPTLNPAAQKRARAAARPDTAGSRWFDLPATPVTSEIARDFHILQHRAYLDPKRFYKKESRKTPPKFFHIGTVVDSPLEARSQRITAKERRPTWTEELMADRDTRGYLKRKFHQVEAERDRSRGNPKAKFRQNKKRK